MADERKFIVTNTEQAKTPKDFNIPLPGFQSKPTVIIGQQALRAYKRIFISMPKPGKREEKEYLIEDSEVSDLPVKDSKIFNQPVYSDITFHSNSYVDQNNNTVTFQELQIDLVVLSVMNTKNIIETTLQGRNGTVKEYISDGDYQIKIDGMLYGKGMNNYPQDEVQKLINICLAPQSINVTSSFLKLFNVEDIVIKSYNIDQQVGMRNCQPFTLNCVSDFPLILLKNA